MNLRFAAALITLSAVGTVTPGSAGELRPSMTMPGGPARQTCGGGESIYEQIGAPTGRGIAAQDFEAAYDAYDCAVADDFQLTFTDYPDFVYIPGSYSAGGGPASAMVVQFYADAGGYPGAVLCSGVATILDDQDGNIFCDLPFDCVFTAGTTYWVSVAARMDYLSGGQWYASTESVTTGNIGKWYNPGDGFGLGCTSWPSCDIDVMDPGDLDLSFCLEIIIPVELQRFVIE